MESNTRLEELFHALPFELKELIQRFTYKTQNKHLLNEIRDIGTVKHYLQELTALVDTANYTDGFQETTDGIYERLWPGLNMLREYYNKDNLIKNWKYKSEFLSTERAHENGEKQFNRLTWKASFAVNFWMCIYH